MFTQESGTNLPLLVKQLRQENKRLSRVNIQLRAENNLLSKLVENSRTGMFVKNSDNMFTLVNSAFCQHLGLPSEKLLFKEPSSLPKTVRKYIGDDAEILKSGGVVFNLIEDLDKSGETTWVETVKFPVLDESQQVAGVFGFTYDMTDTFSVQKELQLNKVDLKKAHRVNEALRQFSYAASHDLQEPIRSVQGFLGILKMEYSDRLDQNADLYLEKANDNLVRMQQLIKDILDYAVINGAKYQMEPVDLNEVVHNVVLNLDQAIKDHEATIEVEPLPKISGSQGLLIHYFQNMISNALKYRSPKKSPHIKIFSNSQKQGYVIGIEDNGIGIDPIYFKEIFKPFKRLHRQTEVQGSGIGLATSKKIADIHQGKLWVESQPNSGSTFYMEVPR